MSRFRALLAILLAFTWCSAAWHAELEAVGLMLEHDHQGHSETADVDQRVAGEHEPLFVSQLLKDARIRIGIIGVFCIALLGNFVASGLALWRADAPREPIPIEGRIGPPLEKVWHFVQRRAPESAAPPALA